MASGHPMAGYRSLTHQAPSQRLRPGTVRRVVGYARPYRRDIAAFLVTTVLDSLTVVMTPLLFKYIIDQGVVPKDMAVVITGSVAIAVVAVVDAAVTLAGRYFSARVGEGLIYDLRRQVFEHVQRMPLAFFTRTQTGSLVSRLNSDVVGAQQAITSTLSSVVSNGVSVVLVLVTMAALSWQVTVVSLLLVPLFLLPAKWVGTRLAMITRESMQLNATMSQTMTERFNVAGALLVKIFGRPTEELGAFSANAGRVRDIGITQAMYGRVLFTALSLVAALATALVYGLGGALAVNGALQVGSLVALAALLTRLYGPITALSNVQVDVLTALVSFDRVFEVLDLRPMVDDADGAVDLPRTADTVTFRDVSFRYPAANEVSLASLESVAALDATAATPVLHGVSFTVPAGTMTALVGPSGAGKSTITSLVSRLYDVTTGAVVVGGLDVRAVTQQSLHDAVGVVSQDAHLFHDTIRYNLAYARPGASDDELWQACDAAQIADVVRALPQGLDTVVGDRGYRLSGGEKQRLALARLLLKAPQIVVLDEATAHLDSESEAAVQRALATALAGRTSLVIAHRLSTVRDADQILVIEDGRVVQSGTHESLLASGGLYADLYRTQFAGQREAPVG